VNALKQIQDQMQAERIAAYKWKIMGSYRGGAKILIESYPTESSARYWCSEYQAAFGAGWIIELEGGKE